MSVKFNLFLFLFNLHARTHKGLKWNGAFLFHIIIWNWVFLKHFLGENSPSRFCVLDLTSYDQIFSANACKSFCQNAQKSAKLVLFSREEKRTNALFSAFLHAKVLKKCARGLQNAHYFVYFLKVWLHCLTYYPICQWRHHRIAFESALDFCETFILLFLQ